MNKRVIFIIAIALLLVAWWFQRSRPIQPSVAQTKIAAASSANTVVPSNSPSISPTNYPAGLPPIKAFIDPKIQKIEEIWTAENAQSQDFYGKVVDQYGKPVPGAVALGTLLWVQGLDVAEKREQHKTQADHNGEFQFTGFHASRLAVAVSKEGYEMDLRGRAYTPPNAENKTTSTARAIFTMWKLQGAEPMVHIGTHCGLACDGTSTSFDLLTGKTTSSGGDLTISLSRSPLNIDRGKPFDWTMTLQIAGGGLIPVETAYSNEAPAEGYQSSVMTSMAASQKNWSPSFMQTYFFKAENGQIYGRITINIMTNYQPPPTHFEMEIYANPSGSRNLEFDPAKQIPMKP